MNKFKAKTLNKSLRINNNKLIFEECLQKKNRVTNYSQFNIQYSFNDLTISEFYSNFLVE